MKRLFVMLLPVFLFSAPKMPLLEMFTNWGCPYCGPSDDTLDNLYAQYQGQIAIIRYHVSWPDSLDPYYNENPSEVDARVNYYMSSDTFYVPHLYINGTVKGGADNHLWRGMVQTALQDTTPIQMSAQFLVDTPTQAFQIVVQAVNNGSQTYDVMLRTAVIEDSLYAMGPNGHPWHHQVMRKMYPNAVGLHYTLAPGGSLVDTFTGTVKTSWTAAHLRVVSFLQRNITRQVYATTWAEAVLTGVQEPPSRLRVVVRPRPDGLWIGGSSSPVRVRLYRLDGREVPAVWSPRGQGGILRPRDARRGVYLYHVVLSDGVPLRGRLVIF